MPCDDVSILITFTKNQICLTFTKFGTEGFIKWFRLHKSYAGHRFKKKSEQKEANATIPAFVWITDRYGVVWHALMFIHNFQFVCWEMMGHIINNILESQLSSYKIAGDKQSSILVLRFACYRRKSQSQVLEDIEECRISYSKDNRDSIIV